MCRIPVESKKTFLLLQISLLLFFLMAIPMRLYPLFHPDWMDAIRGTFLGISIGLLFLIGRSHRLRAAR